MKRFYFLPKHSVYALDIYATSFKDAKIKIRQFLDLKTLHGVQIWEA
jgi:hypothetical protein